METTGRGIRTRQGSDGLVTGAGGPGSKQRRKRLLGGGQTDSRRGCGGTHTPSSHAITNLSTRLAGPVYGRDRFCTSFCRLTKSMKKEETPASANRGLLPALPPGERSPRLEQIPSKLSGRIRRRRREEAGDSLGPAQGPVKGIIMLWWGPDLATSGFFVEIDQLDEFLPA